MTQRRFTEEDINEMVFLAKKFGSYRKAAQEFGCSYQSVIDKCHQRGFHIPGPHEISKSRKHITIDGISWVWHDKGYYRGSVNGERIMLADYIYRQMFGVAKPKGETIIFVDGNRDNYNLQNIKFVSRSEASRILAVQNRTVMLEALNKGRRKRHELEKQKPWMAAQRMSRSWRTRRQLDPENESSKRGAATRREHAKQQGFWYTPEQRHTMSITHKGKNRKFFETKKRENEKAALRRKMGMA